ncbi:MAG: hypothetical protein FWC54_05130, partial [Actinomycetia bacterium]|nr:hypothetical protein [Actinomycetes bacterium]
VGATILLSTPAIAVALGSGEAAAGEQAYEALANNSGSAGNTIDTATEQWLAQGDKGSSVYQLIDGDTANYIGRTTRDVAERVGEHAQDIQKVFDTSKTVAGNLTLNQSRALEQYLIEQGDFINTGLNKINSLSPTGTAAQYYKGAMQWSADFVTEHGITIR